MLTKFNQFSRSLNVRRKLTAQMRSLVSARIVIISIISIYKITEIVRVI